MWPTASTADIPLCLPDATVRIFGDLQADLCAPLSLVVRSVPHGGYAPRECCEDCICFVYVRRLLMTAGGLPLFLPFIRWAMTCPLLFRRQIVRRFARWPLCEHIPTDPARGDMKGKKRAERKEKGGVILLPTQSHEPADLRVPSLWPPVHACSTWVKLPTPCRPSDQTVYIHFIGTLSEHGGLSTDVEAGSTGASLSERVISRGKPEFDEAHMRPPRRMKGLWVFSSQPTSEVAASGPSNGLSLDNVRIIGACLGMDNALPNDVARWMVRCDTDTDLIPTSEAAPPRPLATRALSRWYLLPCPERGAAVPRGE